MRGEGEGGRSPLQTVDKKLFSPEGGRIALSANERVAEFLDFAIQAKFADVNKLGWMICCSDCRQKAILPRRGENSPSRE